MGRSLRLAAASVALAALATPAAAHAGALSGEVTSAAVPSWLVVMTGGAVIAGSFLFTSLLTDHEAIAAINGLGLRTGLPSAAAAATWLARAAGLLVLAVVVVAGVAGPRYATDNLAILWVWGGWWAGYTITVYAVGNSWPLVNPWRALAGLLPANDRPLPDRAGWASVAGLLGLVWLEVVSPVASNPRFLALVVVAYTAVTLAGAWRYGPDRWFERVDPVARVFRVYGSMAPVQRTEDGLALRLPAAALTDDRARSAAEPAFVVALLWATTYDGLVSTPAWNDLASGLAAPGLPALALYLLTLAAGYLLFLAVYRVAARRARRSARTYVTAAAVERWFVPSLVPIAAGYHLAHYLGYFVSLSPGLAATVGSPLAPVGGFQPLPLPAWFGNLQLSFVVLGHLAGIYVAHALSFDLFPGSLKPIRSQFPFVAVMVAYTVTSVWIITQPFAPPVFV